MSAQHVVATEPIERGQRLAVLGLGLPSSLVKAGFLRKRVEPWIARHRGETEEPAVDNAGEEIERWTTLVQKCASYPNGWRALRPYLRFVPQPVV